MRFKAAQYLVVIGKNHPQTIQKAGNCLSRPTTYCCLLYLGNITVDCLWYRFQSKAFRYINRYLCLFRFSLSLRRKQNNNIHSLFAVFRTNSLLDSILFCQTVACLLDPLNRSALDNHHDNGSGQTFI